MGLKFLLLISFMILWMTLPFSFLKPLSTIYYTYTATVHTKQSHTGLTLLSIKYPQHKYLTRKCSCFTFINTKSQMEVHSIRCYLNLSLWKLSFFCFGIRLLLNSIIVMFLKISLEALICKSKRLWSLS